MKSKSRILLSVLSLIALSLACNLMTTPAVPPTPTLHADPLVTEAPPMTEVPSPQAVTTGMPAGFMTATEQMLTVYDLNGVQQSQISLPQSTFPGHDRIHLAGPMPANGETVPVLYFSFGDGESLLFRDGDGQIFTIQTGTGFLGLSGALGKPIVAYSQLEYLDTSLRSKIYVGSIQTLPSAAPVSVVDDPESWAIKPILVDVDNEIPSRVWYTRIAYGIGGDIVFEPRKGLFTLDIASGQANTILGNDVSPWDVSEDRTWIAYAAAGTQSNSMCIKNLQVGAETCFPALPAGEPRGVGNAIFSPDAQYVVWMEGDGWQMAEVPNFKSTVRIGQTNGAIIADLPASTFESAAGIGTLYRADPVAWLDTQTVLVQVRGQEWDQAVLVRYNVISRESTYLVSGGFVGLLYP